MTSPEQAMAARLQAEAAERNTPRANLLLAIKSLAAKAEAHPKVWGPAALKAAQLEAISTFERAVTADLQQSLAAATTERERLARINEMLHERLDRNVPCSDHRDKISPGVCPICEAEERTVARLKASKQGIAWNQGYSAAEAKYVAQRDAAYEALRKYGRHIGCGYYRIDGPEGIQYVCSCGLDAALQSVPPQ
jgi:hypothetical protein